jgi:hypothetical protein
MGNQNYLKGNKNSITFGHKNSIFGSNNVIDCDG